MTITVHHLNNSRSHRIVWLLEELGVEYEIKKYERTPEQLAPKELLEVHPLGKSPVITDGDRTIAETGAIIEYLVSRYGPQLAPPKEDEDATLRYKYWLHFAEGSAMPPLVIALIFGMINKQAPWFIKPIAKAIAGGVNKGYVNPNLKRQTAFMEAELSKNPNNWFVKDFSGADVILSFPIQVTQSRLGLTEYPNLTKYLATIEARPAYKRAVEKGGELGVVS